LLEARLAAPYSEAGSLLDDPGASAGPAGYGLFAAQAHQGFKAAAAVVANEFIDRHGSLIVADTGPDFQV
jgi:hypothetical protein